MRILRLSPTTALLMMLASICFAQQQSNSEAIERELSAYRMIIAIEHDSRHLYHLQSKALVGYLGGWARPANEDGSEMDSFVGISEQVIPVNLNRIKARLRRGEGDEETAAEILDIIGVFEDAIETGLGLADQLEAGELADAAETYRDRSTPQYERLWRRTFTLMRAIERRM